ncbi:MAG: hypothetical protein ACR2O5_06730 [Thiogranum sp.]
MSSEFQGFTDANGRVNTTTSIPADPADIHYLRGFAMSGDDFIVKTWDTIETIYWNGSIAVSKEGYILVNSGDPSNGKPTPGGMLADPDGILYMSASGSINIIHQGVGLETDAIVLNDEAGVVQFMEGGGPSVSIGIITPGSCDYSTPAVDCQADGVYEAFPSDFIGVVSYAWNIVSGAATIIGSTTSKQVTVRTDSNLDVTFELRVVATSPEPESAERTTQFTQTHTSVPVQPAAPTVLTATADALLAQIQLNWVDNAVDETGYRVERAVSGAGPWNVLVTGLPPNSNAYLDTDVLANETWFYRVFAYNSAGDSLPSNVDSATVVDVADVRITEIGDVRITEDGNRRVV